MQELLIIKQNNKKKIALTENGTLQEYYEEDKENERLEENIYIGKVKDVLSGMQAAFVDIGEKKNTYIHIRDILPKTSNVTGNKNEDLQKYSIKDYIKKDDNILVQVRKDSSDQKGARITTHIHIPGRFVVILPENNFITVSQKIENIDEKDRLIKIVERFNKPDDIGIIIRTAAIGRTEKEIRDDINNTIQKLEEVNKKYEKLLKENKPQIIYKKESIIEKILLDISDNNLDKIWVNNKELKDEILNIIDKNNNSKIDVEIQENLISRYDIDRQIEKLNNRKIWLKCGGFITIDKTEALTAIDVNSGSYVGKQNLENTVLKVNKEASIEIANQLRLRDIGGIIIIDYIDMNKEESKKEIIETLRQNLKKDRSKTQIMEFTKLNLLEMTRKHMFSNTRIKK